MYYEFLDEEKRQKIKEIAVQIPLSTETISEIYIKKCACILENLLLYLQIFYNYEIKLEDNHEM